MTGIDEFQKVVGSVAADRYEEDDLRSAWRAGVDSVRNGANTTNCHFHYFRTPKHTKAWEGGRDHAQRTASK